MHTGQHYDREMSDAFFEELVAARAPTATSASAPARHGRDDRPHAGGARGGDRGGATRAWSSCWATRTPRWPARWPRPSSASRSPTSRPACAASTRGMPEEINRRLDRPRLAPAVLPHAGRGGQPAARRASARRAPDRRRIHGRGARRTWPRARARPAAVRARRPAAYYLATLHRQENVDDARPAGRASSRAGRRCPLPTVLPVHPRTRAASGRAGPAAAPAAPPDALPQPYLEHAAAGEARRAPCSPTPAACRRRPSSSARRA